ncbi:MAG: cadherin-like domain-containing protein [Anaerolineae bacterium]
METVIAAVIIVILLLSGSLTLMEASVTSQDALAMSWQAMEARELERAQIHFEIIDAQTFEHGSRLRFAVVNTGAAPLTDFPLWDVIVQYPDTLNNHLIQWIPFASGAVTADQWSLTGITLSTGEPEGYDLGLLDPGEQAQFDVQLSHPILPGTLVGIHVSSIDGITASGQAMSNTPPTLPTHSDLTVAAGGGIMITNTRLKAEDSEDPAESLVYTITQAPAQGALSFPDSFTQADVDAGLLTYIHSGSGDDQFEFIVSDGQDTIGPFTTQVRLSPSPTLAANLGASGMANTPIVITNSLLAAQDEDDAALGLRFTVVVPPSQGILSLGTSFTQAQIDDGLLTYTGSASDSFQFTVTDGKSTIGIFTFPIGVLP